MPPRINKRQQREQEELLALGTPPTVADADSEEEITPTAPSISGFAAVSTALKPIHMEIMTMDPAYRRR
jgi:hypothetical protein